MEKLRAYENESDVNTDPDAKANRKLKKARTNPDSMQPSNSQKRTEKKASLPLKESSNKISAKNQLPLIPKTIQPLQRKKPTIVKTEIVSGFQKNLIVNQNPKISNAKRSSGKENWMVSPTNNQNLKTLPKTKAVSDPIDGEFPAPLPKKAKLNSATKKMDQSVPQDNEKGNKYKKKHD